MNIASFFSIKNSLAIIITTLLIAVFSFSFADAQKGQLCKGANLTFNSEVEGRDVNCSTDARGIADGNNPEGRVNSLVTNIVNIFSIIVGIVAVIMVIVGGFKFIISGGDSTKVTSARNTIIYAIVGLIVVALAQFIVKFVLVKIPT
jgi:cytochrome bd-type quinol oxidase subunit 2